MEYYKLNNGVKMPIIGFGVFQITDNASCEKAVLDAIEVGYRLIDTAASYGNEEAVGRSIRTSSVARKDLFITTKLWLEDAGYEKTKEAFERSLQRLQLDYLDLYLIHQPFGDVYGSWRAMEEIYKEGRVKAIGVSNFQPDRLVDLILHNEIIPAVNQVEVNPFHQQMVAGQVMKEYQVQMESWAPFAEGRNNLFKNEVLESIAQKHHRSIAQIILRWQIQREIIVIPKSINKERMIQNLNIFDFKIDEEDIQKIMSLDTGKSSFFSHTDPQEVKRMSELRRKT